MQELPKSMMIGFVLNLCDIGCPNVTSMTVIASTFLVRTIAADRCYRSMVLVVVVVV
jgi:hypothetical protein